MDKSYSAIDKIRDIFGLVMKSFILSFVFFIIFIAIIMAIYYGDLYFNVIVGDIISFYSTEYDSRGMVITHRIINKDKKSNNTSLYTTKGDNNSIADKNSVNTDNVYGKVLFILPKIGFIKNFLSKPINIILCILIPSSFIIVVLRIVLPR